MVKATAVMLRIPNHLVATCAGGIVTFAVPEIGAVGTVAGRSRTTDVIYATFFFVPLHHSVGPALAILLFLVIPVAGYRGLPSDLRLIDGLSFCGLLLGPLVHHFLLPGALSFLALAILYFFMRFYIYHLQITFELSIRKILKNALIFTTLGIKRNLMALLGMVLLTAIVVGLVALTIGLFGMNLLPIPVMISLMIYLAATAFISSYAAYPIIDRYMIAPFVSNEESDVEELEVIDGEEEAPKQN